MTNDFPRPQRTGSQQLRRLRMLHEGVAREFGVALSDLLRCRVEVSLADLDRRTYGEFLESLSEPACFHVLKAAPVEDRLLLDIEPSILHPMIDYLLGGGGKEESSGEAFSSRPLSEIEWRLTARIVHLLLEEICRAWKDTVELKLDVVQVESNPRQLRVLPTDEAVVQVG
jgi:flagellar motor switch protein FliM